MTLVKAPSTPITCQNLVDGSWTASAGSQLAVVSPYSGATIGHVPQSTAGEVDAAVRAASLAFPGWRATPVKERAQVLFRFRELALAQLDELGHLAASEAGKTVAEAKAGILKGLEVCEFATALQNLDAGGTLEVSRGVSCHITREPLGVVAGIVPFNFPAMVPLWMYPIALALGNSFILKPSEKVPLTSQRMAALLLEAGLPKGVFSIVNGTREVAEALIDHPKVKAIGFVGSTPAARAVYIRATSHGKRALALGGAKNQVLLLPDADPKLAVRGIVDSFTGCCGQRCMAASLLIAVGDVEPLLDAVKEEASRLKPGAQLGAIIDRDALTRIRSIIGRAESEGAKIVLDGRGTSTPAGYEQGNWLAPTIIDHARPDMECARAEIFGPVLTILRVKTLAEAMAIEAAMPYGNAVSVFTSSGAAARYVESHATSGMVGVNIGVPVPREPFSFGGTKDSKFGSGDITGVASLSLWSDLKKTTTRWGDGPDRNWMS